MRRLWPLVIPMLLAVHIALPGALGSFRASFFPANGIVAQQADRPGRKRANRDFLACHPSGVHPAPILRRGVRDAHHNA